MTGSETAASAIGNRSAAGSEGGVGGAPMALGTLQLSWARKGGDAPPPGVSSLTEAGKGKVSPESMVRVMWLWGW